MHMTNPWTLGIENKPKWQREQDIPSLRWVFLKSNFILIGAVKQQSWSLEKKINQSRFQTEETGQWIILMSSGPTVHSGWVKALSNVRIVSVDIILQWKPHRTWYSHPCTWTHDQQGELDMLVPLLCPPPQGKDRGSGPVHVDIAAKGRAGFSGLGELRQAQNLRPEKKQTQQQVVKPLFLSIIHPTGICLAGEPNREVSH